MKTQRILLSLILATVGAAQARVDMKDLAFLEDASDFAAGYSIKRIYSSRSAGAGLFGFGWCTELEASLRVGLDGDAGLMECGEEIARLKVGRDGLELTSEGYARSRPDGTRQSFDRRGRLQSLRSARGEETTVSRDDRGRIALVKGRRTIALFYDGESRLAVRAERDDGAKAAYAYEGDLLIAAKSDGRAFLYAYDRLRNLKRVDRPDGSWTRVEYDADRDLAARVSGSDGCVDSFRLEAREARALRYATIAERRCPAAEALAERHEFRDGRGVPRS